jgi:hypothetical protein
MAITMEYVAMRLDRLIELRPRVAGRQCNRIVIRPRRRLKPWGGLGGLSRMLESIMTDSDGEVDKDAASMVATDTDKNCGGADIVARTLYDTYDLLDEAILEGTCDNGVAILRAVGDIGAVDGDGAMVTALCTQSTTPAVSYAQGTTSGFEALTPQTVMVTTFCAVSAVST